MAFPLICPICYHKTAENAELCPNCGHSLKALRRLEICRIFVIPFLGAVICSGGLGILINLNQPAIGLGPFTHWERNKFTDLFLDLRTAAFAFVIVGLLVTIGLPWWLGRRAVDQGVKADPRSI